MKKLDDLPKDNKPATYDEVMAAMAALHKQVLKQAALYGGKKSKLYIPAVVEGSLLQSVNVMSNEDHTFESVDEADRLMDIAHRRAEDLADHLKSKNDSKGLGTMKSLLSALDGAIRALNSGK